MLTVSRPCHIRLTVVAWVVFAISLIIIIAGMTTTTWVVQASTGQSHGLVDCCPKFYCSHEIDVKVYVDNTLAIGLLGFFVSVAGVIASVIFTLCNRQLAHIKCFYFIASITLLGGLLLLIAVIFYAASVPQHINSMIRDYCLGITHLNVGLGDSFGAFAAGSVGVLLAALPLFFAVPRERQPLMLGDFVAVSAAPGTAAGADRPQIQPQTAESRPATNAETVELNRLRPVGSNARPSVNHAFDFWDGPRVTPSAPEFDIIEAPAPFHAIPEQPRLHCSIPEPLEIQYEATEICSVSERPTLHLQISEPPEAEYETLNDMSSYINATNQAVASNAILAHSEMGRAIPKFSAADSDFSEEYCLAEQPEPEHLTSEETDEYVNIEETSAEFVSSSQSGAMYTNLEHAERQCATTSLATSSGAVSERPQTGYNNMEQSEQASCYMEQSVTVITEQSEAEYVAVD